MHESLLKQWLRVKMHYPDKIIICQHRDFFECFEDDARIISKTLEGSLTFCTVGNRHVPLCAVPKHSGPRYVGMLTEQGYHVALYRHPQSLLVENNRIGYTRCVVDGRKRSIHIRLHPTRTWTTAHET